MPLALKLTSCLVEICQYYCGVAEGRRACAVRKELAGSIEFEWGNPVSGASCPGQGFHGSCKAQLKVAWRSFFSRDIEPAIAE
jgi:hypothetical protein